MVRQAGELGQNSAAEAFRQKVVEYCSYRRSDLPEFKVHVYDINSWGGTEVSYKPGCYGFYCAAWDLLYVGKASLSASVGSRCYAHLRHPRPSWLPVPAFVLIVEVSEAFEAPSLEEFLIRELQPKFNDRGIRRPPPVLAAN